MCVLIQEQLRAIGWPGHLVRRIEAREHKNGLTGCMQSHIETLEQIQQYSEQVQPDKRRRGRELQEEEGRGDRREGSGLPAAGGSERIGQR